MTKAIVYGTSKTLTISTTGTPKGAQCTLTIPAGLIYGPNKVTAPEITLNYSTKAPIPIDANPVMATSSNAVALYGYLKNNYGNGILSGMMAWHGTTMLLNRYISGQENILPSTVMTIFTCRLL